MSGLFTNISRSLGLLLVLLSVTIVLVSPKATAPQPRESKQLSQTLPNVPPPPPELPFGGRKLLPNYRFVALYGSPNYPGLGALGQQQLEPTIDRVKGLAATFQPHSSQPIIPTLEIIVSVASSGPTENGDYSQEVDQNTLSPWIQTAKDQKLYVILDLQPGRVSFLDQAKHYEKILISEHVGLALDPEWRLLPNQVHLNQIGHVRASEINQLIYWLADLTKKHDLPQKMLVLHQFRLDMLPDRELIDTSRPELAYVFHVDGQGSQAAKDDTYRSLTNTPPANAYFGWKNFYQKDIGVRSPADTMAVQPTPWLITYQ